MWPHGYFLQQAAPSAPLESDVVMLEIRQQPKEALVTQDGKEKTRKPVDPPPIVQLKVYQHADPAQHFLQSPYLFMVCSLLKNGKPSDEHDNAHLAGSLVSSLHRLKDVDNRDGGFFVFGDVSIKVQGTHRLVFSLFDLRKDTYEISFLKSVVSEPFRVVHPKDFRGLDESTYLSRAFSDQGVRLRLRKEPRAMMGSNSKRAYPYGAAPNQEPSVPSTPLSQHAQPQSLYSSQDDMENSAAKRMRYSESTANTSPENVDPSRTWPTYPARPSSAGYPGYVSTTLPPRQTSYGGYGQFPEQSSTAWSQSTLPGGFSGLPRTDFTYRSAPGANHYGMQSLPSVTGAQAYNARYSTPQYPSTELSSSYTHRDTDTSHGDLTTDPNLPTYRPYTQVTTPTSDSGDTRQAANTLSALQSSQQLHDHVTSSQLSPPQESFLQRSPHYSNQVQVPAFTGASAVSTGYRPPEHPDSHPQAAHAYLPEMDIKHAALPGTEG